MERRELICIGCPLGCPLTVEITGDEISVSGHTCKRGEEYGKKEVQNPTRIVTSTIRVNHGVLPMVSVKTAADIPKGKIFACMKEIRNMTVHAPVVLGQVLIENCGETGVAVVATKTVDRD